MHCVRNFRNSAPFYNLHGCGVEAEQDNKRYIAESPLLLCLSVPAVCVFAALTSAQSKCMLSTARGGAGPLLGRGPWGPGRGGGGGCTAA